MQVTTYYTSFVFGIVASVAFVKRHWIAWLFQVLYGTSILCHAKHDIHFPGKCLVHAVDKTIAHVICIASAICALTQPQPIILLMFVYWCCMTYIFYVYYIAKLSFLEHDKWIPWHASVHVVSSIGMLALLAHEKII